MNLPPDNNPLTDDRRIALKLFSIRAANDTMPLVGLARPFEHRDGTIGLELRLGISATDIWGDAIRALIDKIGGEAKLSTQLEALSPKRRIVTISFPADSPYQENNGLDADSIRLLARLGLELDFNLIDFDVTNETHVDALYDEQDG